MEHLIIIGAGIAGVSAAEAARKASSSARISLLNGELAFPYYRLNLTRFIADEIVRDAVFLHKAEWYEQKNIKLLNDIRILNISTADHKVVLNNKSTLEYDKLIIASGAQACKPVVPGAQLKGVTTLRSLDEAYAIIKAADSKPDCVCIGGGTLGLEAAGALSARGLRVTLLERHEWLMTRHLNKIAGERLEEHVSGKGIEVVKNACVKEIKGDDKVSEVVLDDGRIFPAGLVVVAIGVRPDMAIAAQAGIEINKGIITDAAMRTSAEDVFAAGDVVEHNGILYGTWAQALKQGRIAGINAAGGDERFVATLRYNSIKALGTTIVCIGNLDSKNENEIILEERKNDRFYHLLFRDGKIVGGVVMGDIKSAVSMKEAVDSSRDFSEILRSNPSPEQILHVSRK